MSSIAIQGDRIGLMTVSDAQLAPVSASNSETIYTATDKCTVIVPWVNNNVYYCINATASTRDYDFYFNSNQIIVKNMEKIIERNARNIGYALALDLEDGDYINVYNGTSSLSVKFYVAT